jgi:uncharacterized membrane protein YoaK (UPF0700 family)
MASNAGAAPERGHGSLPAFLLLWTALAGVVDAVSYLRLGHVFVANMTGNVVFLGFAAAGAAGVSAVGSIVALVAFLAGGLVGGRLATALERRRDVLLSTASWLKFAFVCLAAAVALFSTLPLTAPTRYALIAMLAVTMGVQSSTARRIGVPDLSTTVLTMTLVGLASESHFAGGTNPRVGLRLAAVASMLLGAFCGGLLVLRAGVVATLAVTAIVFGVTGLTIRLVARAQAAGVNAAIPSCQSKNE